MKPLPLRELCWDNPASTFFHPQTTSAVTLVDTKVRIGRPPQLTTITEDTLAALRGSRLPTPDVDITGDGYATLTFDTPAPIAFLWTNPVTASPISTHGIAPAANPSTHPPLAGTYGARTHTRAVPVDTAARDNTPAPPPSTPPRRTTHPRPGNCPSSATRLRSPDPTQTSEVESLQAAKEALTALVSASSAAFSTLDARLIEERHLREAAELLQAEDNRLRTKAHIRLNTAVAQHESQQAALAARLPYFESGASGLYLPTPTAPMPPVTDSSENLLVSEEDEPTALGQGPDNKWTRSRTNRWRQTNRGVSDQTDDTPATPLVWNMVDPEPTALVLLLSPLAAATHLLSPPPPLPPLLTPPLHPAIPVLTFGHLPDPYSSDSNNSELLDARTADALQPPPPNAPDTISPRKRHRRRTLRIQRLPLPPLRPTQPDTNSITCSGVNPSKKPTLVTQARHPHLIDSLRIASTNINKNTYGKLGDELATWFHASALDFLISPTPTFPHTRPHNSGPPHPVAASHLTLWPSVTTESASCMICWHARIDARRTSYFPSGRSISICVRLGKGSLLTLIGTYCQDPPAAHREATDQEWQWLAQATTQTTGHGTPHADDVVPQGTTDWLKAAVQNLYDILYTSAKIKWGGTSQTRKALNRAVAIQRTNRCTAQLHHLLRIHEATTPIMGTEYIRLAHMVEWYKWIRNPNLLPSTCLHRSDAIAIGDWWTAMPTAQANT
ncbi:hypothetical protein H257_08145 [Aphanomyces astaci]|uniref:Uncharacterized protein n=1 Tax=Aphanomyces astaci TaxID=112090 RepID=W4GHZ9_APHAT|nr:hypothetical protein H257_08145 [Aphanomyces astaci]ETV78654.1 hypothetical protein H257_08145 [Aphanomyces astaci]|eukprot:XP_009832235.1 hypothetical protein H257_08145 [Aphanomyces astaci]